jgi:hypothetical protein
LRKRIATGSAWSNVDCFVAMLNLRNPVVWLIGIVVIAAISLLLRGHFSAEVSERRRRRRSYRRLEAKGKKRPVKLAVKTRGGKRSRD